MARKPRIICWSPCGADELPRSLESSQWEFVDRSEDILETFLQGEIDGFYVPQDRMNDLEWMFQKEQLLEQIPEGIALLDPDYNILWFNRQLADWAESEGTMAHHGGNFYAALSAPEILGPDFCPFATALVTGESATSLVRTSGNRYLKLHAVPIHSRFDVPEMLVVTASDVTVERLQEERLAAIHAAGIELADLGPDEVFDMELDERIELLKSNIMHQTQELLRFDVVEIRLLDQETGQLKPLLSVGINSDASDRPLYARVKENGVTGFVAATGKSYLCEDTTEDPLYIEGFKGAKSSMTVPLKWHDDVIGTFNVESPEPQAFDEKDLEFLEMYAREIAVALNTLELLVAQKADTAQQSVEAIHSAVALPVDEILNDAVNVMEQYIGHESDVVERLKRILHNARDIKQVIHKVGQRLTPAEAVPAGAIVEKRPKLMGVRVLVADQDESVRNDAHALLERYGCVVETAHSGREAVLMVRSCSIEYQYDVIISDIRLPDMDGYELLCRLREIIQPVPLVLMTGFGYDPAHTIVKSRRAGLHSKAILYKPFRLDQLLEVVELMVDVHARVNTS